MRRPNTRSPGTGPAVRSWVGRGADEQLVDGPLHNVIGRQADRVSHPPPLQRLIEGGQGERRVRADDDGLAVRAVLVNDGQEHLVPPVRAVDVARRSLAARQSPSGLKTNSGW